MKYKFAVLGAVVLVAAGLIWYKTRHPASGISCDQNNGPFTNASNVSVSKNEIKAKLNQYYAACLKPLYTKGYLETSNDQNSESEAYALLQSYWASDKFTFAAVLNWTNANIKHQDDNLFAWKFDATDHVTILDQNSATDADTDIAYALYMAGSAWKNQTYIDEAKQISNSIWEKETVELEGTKYVTGGAWANQPDRIVVDPSYYSPQAYRTFAIHDSAHDWNKLISDTYKFLNLASNFQNTNPALPPNWVQVDKPSGNLVAYKDKSQSSDFGYDAFRNLWRVSFDQLQSPSIEASQYLAKFANFAFDWGKDQTVCALYLYQNGNYVCDKSTTGTLAAPLGLFSMTNQTFASQLVAKYYIQNSNLQFPDKDFYARSWHWFGLWLWSHS